MHSIPVLRRLRSLLALVMLMAAAAAASAQDTFDLPTTTGERLTRATADECYNGIGVNYPPGPPCATGRAKVNQSYVWALARSADQLWFGTMANTHCLVEGAYLGQTTPRETASYVCEFGSSQPARSAQIPARIGDFRPPKIYTYNLSTRSQVERTVPAPYTAALNSTLGLRAAGILGNVVLLAGPSLQGGVNVFAFRLGDGQFLAYARLAQYANIRKMLVVNGVLYAAAGRVPSDPAQPGEKTGRVLRWTGNETSPIAFTEVGVMESMASELAEHEGRLFVSTWPDVESSGAPAAQEAGLYMSPLLNSSGLNTSSEWARVWKASDYEPDPVTAATYGGGALASYGGYLYWGTMHVPMMSTISHIRAYPADAPASGDQDGLLNWASNSERAISIFRGRFFDTAPQLQVVYGESAVPSFVKVGADPGGWQTVPTGMGDPLWGPSGFGNRFNNYTWSMSVFNGRLWVGTMDWSWLANEGLSSSLPTTLGSLTQASIGADLWYFPGVNSPALPENLNGIGNPANYGVRNMVADTQLYLGMANPMNLRTNPDEGALGGWELLALTPRPTNTPQGAGVHVDLANGNSVRFCGVSAPGSTYATWVPTGTESVYQTALSNSGLQNLIGVQPQGVLLMASSADWRSGCAADNLGEVTLSVAGSNRTSRIYQLYWRPGSGGFQLRDITTSADNGQVRGRLTSEFTGVLLVFTVTEIPTLSTWGMICLACLLGLLAVRRMRCQVPRSKW